MSKKNKEPTSQESKPKPIPPLKRIQTAEGWKRDQIRKRKSSKR